MTVLDKELAEAKLAIDNTAETHPVADAPCVEAKTQTLQTEERETVPQQSPRERAKRMNETARLRRILVQSQMADLHSANSLSNDAESQLREAMQVRNAVSKALSDARTAASTARVLQLDPETLEAKIEGVTISRKTILQ